MKTLLSDDYAQLKTEHLLRSIMRAQAAMDGFFLKRLVSIDLGLSLKRDET